MKNIFKNPEKILIFASMAMILIIGLYALRNRQNIDTRTAEPHAAADLSVRKKINSLMRDDVGHEVPEVIRESDLAHSQPMSPEAQEDQKDSETSFEQNKLELDASYKKDPGIELKSEAVVENEPAEKQMTQNRQQEPDPTEIIDFVMKNRTTKF